MTPERGKALKLAETIIEMCAKGGAASGNISCLDEMLAASVIAAESDLSTARAEIGRLRKALGAVFCYTCHRRVEEVGIRPLGCNACLNLRNALAPPAKTRPYDEPHCDHSGTCMAPEYATGTTNCVYCGKELRERSKGEWFTWDAPEDGDLPQSQASKIRHVAPPAKVDAVCGHCKGDAFICAVTKQRWTECVCGWCERGPAHRIPCPDCHPSTPARRWRVFQALDPPHYPPKIARDPEADCRTYAALAPGRVAEWSDDGGVTWRAE